ncbi:hypothetical protein D0Y65_020239 [Glycine soja]|uniref:Uncharacterized protein n=1 Tax=Glycine soja TaxID=3848 RepID=A0A445JD47_GLYSO|nr:hypothetical protein D0Y65_020239 [Glycine soja]
MNDFTGSGHQQEEQHCSNESSDRNKLLMNKQIVLIFWRMRKKYFNKISDAFINQ